MLADPMLHRRKGHMDRKTHWEAVYTRNAPDGVSWFQSAPTVSAHLLDAAGLTSHT